MTTDTYSTVFKLMTLGYSVLPSGGGESGKAPLVNWQEWQTKAPSESQLEEWEATLKPQLWGIVTNERIAVIDADTPEVRAELEAELGPPHVITPRGGAHFYVNTIGHPLKTGVAILPGLDVRARGGFVNIAGGKYEIQQLPSEDNLIPFSKIPERILAALNGKKSVKPTKQGTPIPESTRNDTLTSIAGAMRRKGAEQTAIEAALLEVNSSQCTPPLPEREVLQIAKSTSRYEPQPDYAQGLKFHLTDYGNAERLSKQFGKIIRYSPERSKWLIWNGKFWEWDIGSIRIAQLAKKTARSIYHEVGNEEDDALRQKLVKHATNTESQVRLESMVASLQSQPDISVMLSELDTDHWLLNTNNGTIDLKTGTIKRHDPTDMITKIVPVDYDPDAECPKWMKFLNDTTEGDEDLVNYLQLIFGVCLTGDMLDQIFFYLYGLGQNGKTTFTDKLLEITGDYGMRVDSEMFMIAEKSRGSASESTANIRGKRLVISSEVPEGRKLNTGLLKDLTGGGEVIRARRLYEHEIEFKPTCKIVMFGNYKPTITESTLALWRRLKLVPFNHTVSDQDRDQLLGDKLSKELPGILSWAIRGCLIWQDIRFLAEPSVITNATREYRTDEDLLADFLADKCKLGAELFIDQASMKKAYHQWCEDNSITPLGPKKFAIRLTEKGCRKTHHKGLRSWVGVTLK